MVLASLLLIIQLCLGLSALAACLSLRVRAGVFFDQTRLVVVVLAALATIATDVLTLTQVISATFLASTSVVVVISFFLLEFFCFFVGLLGDLLFNLRFLLDLFVLLLALLPARVLVIKHVLDKEFDPGRTLCI